MSASSCDRVFARLPLFAGGDVDAAEAELVRTHLIACMSCRNEAASLQRATAGLRDGAGRAVSGVDEALFTSMHDEILARVGAIELANAGSPGGSRLLRNLGLALAAAALVGIGFWWGMSTEPDSVWNRPPTATTAVFEAPKAVPWSGPRAPMRLLGNDSAIDAAGAPATGLRGREELRSLVDDGMILILPRPKRR